MAGIGCNRLVPMLIVGIGSELLTIFFCGTYAQIERDRRASIDKRLPRFQIGVLCIERGFGYHRFFGRCLYVNGLGTTGCQSQYPD